MQLQAAECRVQSAESECRLQTASLTYQKRREAEPERESKEEKKKSDARNTTASSDKDISRLQAKEDIDCVSTSPCWSDEESILLCVQICFCTSIRHDDENLHKPVTFFFQKKIN